MFDNFISIAEFYEWWVLDTKTRFLAKSQHRRGKQMSLLPPILEERISNFHQIWEGFLVVRSTSRNPSQISFPNIPSGEEFLVVENTKISSPIIKKKYHRFPKFLLKIFLQLPLGKNLWWWKIVKSLQLLLKKPDNQKSFPNFFPKYSYNYQISLAKYQQHNYFSTMTELNTGKALARFQELAEELDELPKFIQKIIICFVHFQNFII
jgi:hypothetical protein